MAYPGAEVVAPSWRARVASPLVAGYRKAARALEAYPLERIGLAAIAAGIVLRLWTMWTMDFRSDGDTYTAMGQAWALRQEFLMPYGDVTTWGPTPPGYANHYPPAYPFYLGIWFTLFGFGLLQAKAAAVFVSVAAVAAVYLTTRNLYGATAAALVGGLIALEPHLIWVTGTGFSENMVLLFFAVTMWAIVKSLHDDRYIVIAGLAAGLAYLSRASVGYFFVVAGAGGFLWRFAYMRWRVFTNVWYMAAIAIFLSIMGAWAWRNVSLFGWGEETLRPAPFIGGAGGLLALVGVAFLALLWIAPRHRTRLRWIVGGAVLAVGGAALAAALAVPLPTLRIDVPRWETSSYVRYVQTLAFQNPDQWGHALWMKLPLFLGFLAWYVVPFLPESWRATKRIREEETSALWLSVFLVWVLAWAITSMFWVFEKSWIYWLDNHRYVVIGLLPLGWLLVREMRLERASTRFRVILLMLSLFAAGAGTFASPVKFSDLRAAEHMDPYLQEGDQVAVDGGTIKYAFYAYLTHPEQIQVYGCQKASGLDKSCTSGYDQTWVEENGYRPEFIITLKEHETYGPDYTRVYQHNQTYWNGGVMRAVLWAHDDVIAARGIETGIYATG